MPVPIPFLIGGALIAAVAAAMAYFFTSNRAEQNREEMLQRVEAVVQALQQKAELLRDEIERLRAERDASKARVAELEAELRAARAEMNEMMTEAERWRRSGMTLGMVAQGSLVAGSSLLKTHRYRPEHANRALDARLESLKVEIARLESRQED